MEVDKEREGYRGRGVGRERMKERESEMERVGGRGKLRVGEMEGKRD